MKVAHLSNGDIQGGAARAAYRIHECILHSGGDSRMIVRNKASDDWRVESAEGTIMRSLGRLRPPLGKLIGALQKPGSAGLRNGAWIPSQLSGHLNSDQFDVVNLHWIADETVSVGDLLKVRHPLVWTLHDMWPFCGMEHYASTDKMARWRVGYTRSNKQPTAKGIDLDRLLWRRKKQLRNRQLTFVAPSTWLRDCIKGSAIFSDNPVEVIPHPLDLEVYKPLDRAFCRDALRLPADAKLILFGAVGGHKDDRKGFDLLQEALDQMFKTSQVSDFQCCVFGQSQPKLSPKLPFPINYLGELKDNLTLAMIYSAADVMVVPSRQEAFGQTASEATACGCPVLAFDETGVADIISHRTTGYLASPFEVQDLVAGLSWILEDEERQKWLRENARKRAETLWSSSTIAHQYLNLYGDVMEEHRSRG